MCGVADSLRTLITWNDHKENENDHNIIGYILRL